MIYLSIYALSLVVILCLMTLLWLISLIIRNASIVDIFWGTGFVIVNAFYFILTPEGYLPRKLLGGILVTIWGLRLSGYILWRNWGKPEDFRYAKWRQEASGNWWWRSFFKVFLLQAFLMWLISAPLLAFQAGATPGLTIVDYVAVFVWAVGFFFEAVGDWQMARFKSRPENKGKVLQSGVWRFTRHPNYFGDAFQWWAFFLFALAAGGWWTVFSPLLMTLLLLRVSGVTLLEKTLVESKPGYEEYVRSTSPFVPWLPRKRS